MIVLDVVGLPAPQGSKTKTRFGVIEGSSDTGRASLKAWRESVRNAAQDWLAEHPQSPLDQPLSVRMDFRFPLPSGDPHRFLHTVKPDLDKCVRASLDALVHGGLLKDDSRVCEVKALKTYARPGETVGCTISVNLIGWVEAEKRSESKAAAKAARSAPKHDDGQVSLLS